MNSLGSVHLAPVNLTWCVRIEVVQLTYKINELAMGIIMEKMSRQGGRDGWLDLNSVV